MRISSLLFSSSLVLNHQLIVVTSNYDAKAVNKFWLDSATIVENLNEYKAFWIQPHGCVWSECAVDDTDDAYLGDNRDGDEQWYQYRTQEFCANAAYSLYGLKKYHMGGLWGCTKGHFIDSFFTYGGADILLQSVGKTPNVYNNGNNNDNNNNNKNNNNDDDGYAVYAPNSECQEIDYEYDDDYRANNNNNDDGGNSNSGDNGGFTSTLGCDADGKYEQAVFADETCNGNYYVDALDALSSYNKQHNSIGRCHKIKSKEMISFLLNNSWSCDQDLYPQQCPDPYGKKEEYDYALRTISHGGDANLAYRVIHFKPTLQFWTWIFAICGGIFFLFGYYITNRERIRSKSINRIKGFCLCAWEDIRIKTILFWKVVLKPFCIKLFGRKKGKNQDNDDDDDHDEYNKNHENTSPNKGKKSKNVLEEQTHGADDDYQEFEDGVYDVYGSKAPEDDSGNVSDAKSTSSKKSKGSVRGMLSKLSPKRKKNVAEA